jgi:membrane-bound lytic murein transglycosylase B
MGSSRGLRALTLLVGACASIAACGSASAPAPDGLAEQIAANDAELRTAIDEWRDAAGDPPAGQAPDEVIEPALYVQRKVRFLSTRRGVSEATLDELEPALRKQLHQLNGAARSLRRLSGGGKPRKVKVGKPLPLSELVALYEEAERDYGIASEYLAAINLVETKFGRVKSKSTAGAQGPMQFIPSTWRIYGRGGDVQDPADAIPAAARLLRDHGAPGNYRRALYHYNPSGLYVDAVSRYAKEIARDPDAIHFLYCWGP